MVTIYTTCCNIFPTWYISMISRKKIISPCRINQLVLVEAMECVFGEVETEFLYM